MAHIHQHRLRRHDPYQGYIRRRSVRHMDDERGLRSDFGDETAFRGNGSIPGRRRHGGFGNRDAMAMGAGLHGGMSGRGPKGYVRSDDRIREDVCDCLMDDPHLDASAIEVRVENGDVMLSGTVDSRRARRHAEDLVERVCGVKDVHGNLRIEQRPVQRHGGTL